MMNRKRRSATLLLAGILFCLTACGYYSLPHSVETPELDHVVKNKLYVVTWQNYGSDDADFLAEFEAEHECKIVHTYMRSEDDLLTRLKTAKEGEIDVCLPNCTILPAAIRKGLLEQLDPGKLSNFHALFDRFQTQAECFDGDGKMYAVPFVWGSTAIAYNTNTVKQAPTSIQALFDPAYSGRIAFRDDYNDAIMTAALAVGQDPNNPDLEAVRKKLQELKSLNVTYWQIGKEFSRLFAKGQVDLALMWSGQTATMKLNGDPIAFSVPREGGIGWVDNWAISATSQNKELAYQFIDAMLEKDFQYKWSTRGGPAPVNQEAAEAIDPEYASTAGMDLESLNRLVFMQYRDDKVKQEWSGLWNEIKLS